MNRYLPALCALIITTASAAIGQPLDAGKLRNAITLPKLDVTINFGVTPSISEWWVTPPASGSPTAQAPTDAARLLQLAEASTARKDDDGASRLYGQAAALLVHQTAAHPNDAESLLEYGTALHGLDRNAEAEPLLRRVVRLAPDNWHAWIALGKVLQANAFAVAIHPPHQMSVEEFRAWSQTHPLTAAQNAQKQKLTVEAQAAFDRAVAIQPHEAEPYFERATFRIGVLMAQVVHDFAANALNTTNGPGFMVQLVQQPQVVADIRRAAQLSPNNPRVLSGAATFEIFGWMLQRAQEAGKIPEPGSAATWNDLPPTVRQTVQGYLDRLQKLVQISGSHSPTALDALARVQFLAGDSAASERNFRQVIAMDPKQEGAWQYLIALLAWGRRVNDLVPLLRQHLTTEDSVFTRLMLAKCLAQLSQPGAEEQVRAALKLAPHNLTADVTLAALLLKNTPTSAARTEAGALLDEVDRLYANSHPADEWVEYRTIWGIYLALSGKVAEGRQTLQEVSQSAPDNEDVRNALTALG
ncbi:MAG: hypothetical protein M3Y56_16555 [Armatimonadota bacterium]|nr:hypothetical protein [Armatimonadota bacterium]